MSRSDSLIWSEVNALANVFAGWMLSMSGQLLVLVLLLCGLTWLLRNRTSARFRYALWLIVPVRLVLPPTFALATSWGWWCLPAQHAVTQPALTSQSQFEPASLPRAYRPAGESSASPAALFGNDLANAADELPIGESSWPQSESRIAGVDDWDVRSPNNPGVGSADFSELTGNSLQPVINRIT